MRFSVKAHAITGTTRKICAVEISSRIIVKAALRSCPILSAGEVVNYVEGLTFAD